MTAEYALRPATQGDRAEILELMRLTFGADTTPGSDVHWRWKHVENPFGPSPALLAHAGGLLVGVRVFMRWRWQAGGREVRAVRAVDTATHPEWQGRGIFSRLTRALLEHVRSEGVSFVFNTPNDQSRPGYLKMGWISVGRVSLWVRPVARALLGSALRSRSRADRTVGAPAAELFAAPGLSRFCAAVARPADRLATRWDAEYLRWRYAAIPDLEYRAVWALEGDEGAVIVFRSKRDGRLDELRLCQVIVGGGRRSLQMGGELVRELASRTAAPVMTCMAASNTPARKVLIRSGFLPAPRLGPVMTVRPLSEPNGRPDPLRRSDWDLSIGDLELF